MSILPPLSSMTLEDKLLVMEARWDDLCQLLPSMDPPAWHRDILEDRDRNLQMGSDELSDWEDARRAIREWVA